MTHICVSKLTIIGSDNGLSPGRRQAIIWTNGQWWNIVNWTLGNKVQLNLNRNLNIFIFIQENAVWKMVAILSRPQCVNPFPSCMCVHCVHYAQSLGVGLGATRESRFTTQDSGPAFVRLDLLDPWMKDQLIILPFQIWNFVICGISTPAFYKMPFYRVSEIPLWRQDGLP